MGYFSSAPQRPFTTASAATAVTGGPIVIFTVTLRVIIYQLFARVSTVVGAVATTIRLSSNVAGTDSNLCAASADIANSAVGRIFSVDGTPATALLLGTGEGAGKGTVTPMIVQPGTIDLVVATGGTTGAAIWYAQWAPLDNGATLV